MEIMANRLDYGYHQYQNEYEEKALKVLRSGWYVLGEEVKNFEKEFAEYTGTEYCVGLASGLDALWIAVRLLGIGKGDEVIVQGNTYIASVMGITMNGATPIFVEPDEYFQINAKAIEDKITNRTKAIMVVHLYGIATPMEQIVSICKKNNLRLIEDCAQSHGAKYNGKMTGSFGDVGCFSFYPSKNLGAFGDAGAVVVHDKSLAEEFKVFRNYGSEKRYYNRVIGANSRLDELQAGLLRVKLEHIDEIIAERCHIAENYSRKITNSYIKKPKLPKGSTSVWHQYVIRCKRRKELQDYLSANGIHTIIHYPIPPHLAEAYKYLQKKRGDFPVTEDYADSVLSLPIYNGMTDEESDYVAEIINKFS